MEDVAVRPFVGIGELPVPCDWIGFPSKVMLAARDAVIIKGPNIRAAGSGLAVAGVCWCPRGMGTVGTARALLLVMRIPGFAIGLPDLITRRAMDGGTTSAPDGRSSAHWSSAGFDRG